MHLYYQECGAGEPLLLLHGNGEDSSYFTHQMAPFAERFHVMALDTRGHGKSPHGEEALTLTACADDLYDFLEEHHLEQVHLLGFSDGANIALLFALQHPDRVKTMVLNGGNLNPAGVKRQIQWPITWGYHMTGWLSKWMPKAAINHEMLGLMVEGPHIDPAVLAHLTMPVLVIAGTNDMILESHTKLIYQSLPNSKLSLLEGDHFIAQKSPELFNRIVLDFWKKHA